MLYSFLAPWINFFAGWLFSNKPHCFVGEPISPVRNEHTCGVFLYWELCFAYSPVLSLCLPSIKIFPNLPVWARRCKPGVIDAPGKQLSMAISHLGQLLSGHQTKHKQATPDLPMGAITVTAGSITHPVDDWLCVSSLGLYVIESITNRGNGFTLQRFPWSSQGRFGGWFVHVMVSIRLAPLRAVPPSLWPIIIG